MNGSAPTNPRFVSLSPRWAAAVLIFAAIAGPIARGADAADAKITAASTWHGRWSTDDRKTKTHGGKAVLRIATVHDHQFTATLTLNGLPSGKPGRRALTVEGRSTATGGLELTVTGIDKGNWPRGTVGQVLTGSVNGDQIDFRIPRQPGADADSQGLSVTLTSAKASADK